MSTDDWKADKFLVATVEASRMKARGRTSKVAIDQRKNLQTVHLVEPVQ